MMPRTTTARAPDRRRDEQPRPPLRVVEPADRQSLRPARVGTLAGVVLFVALFALAAFQTVLINSQSHLDDLNQQVAEQEARSERLELLLADLQSPQRITSAARERLGMVAPNSVTFLESSPDDELRAGSVGER
jgi:cell division protein FtsL